MWLDNQYVLAAGIFGRNPQASADFVQSIGVERDYADYREMAAQEAGRLDVVAVVTPPTTPTSRSQKIRFVAAEHASGWASAQIDQWRMDPDIGGAASAVGDAGTHAIHLLRYITGLEATAFRPS